MIDRKCAALAHQLATQLLVSAERRAAVHPEAVYDPSFADWLRGERERLRGIAIHVLKRLLERETGQAAISAGRRLLELDPLGEDAHRTLMRRYAEAGEIGAALKQYEQCRDILQRELAAKPSPDTEVLHRNDPRSPEHSRHAASGTINQYDAPGGAIRRVENAIRLNPFYPDWYLRLLAFAYFCIGNYTKVIDIVHRARQPHAGLLRLLAAAHIMLDQREQAEAARAEMLKLEPWFTIATLRKGLPFKDPAFGEPYFAALRKAGLPE